MENKANGISDDVLIEIIHSIKDIIVELIDRAFPKQRDNKED